MLFFDCSHDGLDVVPNTLWSGWKVAKHAAGLTDTVMVQWCDHVDPRLLLREVCGEVDAHIDCGAVQISFSFAEESKVPDERIFVD